MKTKNISAISRVCQRKGGFSDSTDHQKLYGALPKVSALAKFLPRNFQLISTGLSGGVAYRTSLKPIPAERHYCNEQRAI